MDTGIEAETTTYGEATQAMQAIVQRDYGSADTLEFAEIPRPSIGPGAVLIEVRAAGVDRGVWHIMTGLPYLIRLGGYGVTKPKSPVPGLDVSGEVVEVADDVERFEVGDEVFGIARGSYAEYAAADESKLAHKPANITFEQAAVASVSGITAVATPRAMSRCPNRRPPARPRSATRSRSYSSKSSSTSTACS